MTETVHPEKSPSPFLSVFRKKRPSPAISAPGDFTNGSSPPPPSSQQQQPPAKPPKSPKSPQMSFTQRVKMHKDLRSGKIPDFFVQTSQSQILPSTSMAPFPLFNKKGDKKSDKLKKNKALSADAINHMDPAYLTEALEAFGDDQPIVARSIPKHAVLEIDPKKELKRQRDNCLYEPEVYDKMLSESLMVCDMLQMHLNDCISNTRAKSPLNFSSSPSSPSTFSKKPMPTTTTTMPMPTTTKAPPKSAMASSSSPTSLLFSPKKSKPSKKLTYAV